MRLTRLASLVALFAFAASALGSEPGAAAAGASGNGAHHDPVAPLVLALAVILVIAKVGGDIAVRLKQPAVLGELVAGVVLGNIHHIAPGITFFAGFMDDPMIDMIARLGVLLLLFEVGLESTVGQMMKVGASAFLVAIVGVVVPMVLGLAVGELMLPDDSFYAHLFLGATLCATSVGITARVLKDLSAQNGVEARIILGAAVIDDVLGLVVLAVVAGIITAANTGDTVSVLDALWIIAKATLFLGGALVIGVLTSKRLFRAASYLRARGVLLATGLAVCFVLSWAADAMGLAAIVGAFAAGLVLEDVHWQSFKDRGESGLEHLVAPITSMLVPVFFVVMGMRTDLRAFTDPSILGLAALITLAAILGKQACALAALRPHGVVSFSRITIGFGMIPRGEVGLIFANMGLTLSIGGRAVVSPRLFSALVVMVIVTTMVTPPLLRWSLGRASRATVPPAPAKAATADVGTKENGA